MRRRPLATALLELLDSLSPDDTEAVAVRHVFLDLPFEVRLEGASDRPELLADLPRWRWRTYFDEAPSRLALVIGRAGSPQ